MDSSLTNTVRVTAEFDRSLIWAKGHSVRYLCVSLTAPAAAEKPSTQPPLNLALVLDASGSMNGPKLEAAKQAALGLLERLSERDVLSVVSFASEVITHIQPAPLNADNKRTARLAIEALKARDSTHLSGGWLCGADCVAAYMKTRADCRNRVLLLTDGQANMGVMDPLELGRQAETLCGRGISTSAVGIGDGYSSAQIQSIAVNGGGQLHHANTPEHIIDVVTGELSDLAGTAAENATIEVVFSPGVKVEPLGDFPTVRQEQQVRCTIGALIAERTRLAIFRVTAPNGPAGEQLPFHPRVQWTPVGSSTIQTVAAPPAILRFAEEAENCAQPRRMDLSVETARVWQGTVLRQAVALNREGRYQDARTLLERELRDFERYCQGLPDTAALVEEMRKTLHDIGMAWGEGRRKEAEVRGWKMARQERDHRR